MGATFDIMLWNLSVVYLLSGFLPAFLLIAGVRRLFMNISFIRVYNENFVRVYPISSLLYLLFQFYNCLTTQYYCASLNHEIPGNILYIFIFILSIVPLLLFFVKQIKNQIIPALLINLALLLVILADQLYPFIPLDTEGMREMFLAIGKSVVWFLVLGLLFTLSVLFRNKMEKNQNKKSGISGS